MRKLRPQIINFGKRYSKAIITITTLFIFGCALGVMLSCFVKQDKLAEIGETVRETIAYSGTVDNRSLFKEVTKEYLILFLLIWICSLSFYMVPFSVLIVILKGIIGGLSSGVIVRSIGADGIVFSAVNTLLKNILFAPIFIVLTVVSIRKALRTKQIRPVKNKKHLTTQVVEIAFIILVSVFLGGFESYFVSIIN